MFPWIQHLSHCSCTLWMNTLIETDQTNNLFWTHNVSPKQHGLGLKKIQLVRKVLESLIELMPPFIFPFALTKAFRDSAVLPSFIGICGVAPWTIWLIVRVPAKVLCKHVVHYINQVVSLYIETEIMCFEQYNALHVLFVWPFCKVHQWGLPCNPCSWTLWGSSFWDVLCGESESHLWQVKPEAVLVKEVPRNSCPSTVFLHSVRVKSISIHIHGSFQSKGTWSCEKSIVLLVSFW